jgi:hypothetical protein
MEQRIDSIERILDAEAPVEDRQTRRARAQEASR